MKLLVAVTTPVVKLKLLFTVPQALQRNAMRNKRAAANNEAYEADEVSISTIN